MTNRECSIEFTVADNGRGLDNFREGQGTAIVRHLAGLLESAVDYRSTSSGTIARLTLPVAEKQIAERASAVRSPLSEFSGLLPGAHAADADRMGKERFHLPGGWRGSVSA